MAYVLGMESYWKQKFFEDCACVPTSFDSTVHECQPELPFGGHESDCQSLKPIHEDGPCNCKKSEVKRPMWFAGQCHAEVHTGPDHLNCRPPAAPNSIFGPDKP